MGSRHQPKPIYTNRKFDQQEQNLATYTNQHGVARPLNRIGPFKAIVKE